MRMAVPHGKYLRRKSASVLSSATPLQCIRPVGPVVGGRFGREGQVGDEQIERCLAMLETMIAAFAIDLSSARVRIAIDLIDGVRQGQPLPALVGYRIERRLHESDLDRLSRRHGLTDPWRIRTAQAGR
jgi:hypothetical protein